ncbi:peptidyl-prolyl cis-trans isomerase [Thalassotalea mangrovi]|uniref:peptidylprolyl isomerase n=1 Tax=Thalassotalea mangrovi TaxID=2572245 RepID=A0A4U1B774_9GAMM|nr:peptidyl-prolyl cis-trans isomerase [Thalassotalea mangrovi]TKB46323.1 hypothetical protein E8M12_04525 [Thalassotalea mangrovi]
MHPILKQPLLHFLLIGLILSASYLTLQSEAQDTDGEVIQVNRDSLLSYMQYRNKSFNAERATELFDAMPADERAQLINDYVREEVLFNEAQKLGLDANDFVIRQRMIQKMTYLTQSLVETDKPLSESDLQEFYLAHKGQYVQSGTLTFTHIFFDFSTQSDEQLQQMRNQLNRDGVNASEALTLGQPFLFQRHYAKRNTDLIASHFGQDFIGQLDNAVVDNQQWQGPFRSSHGWHLVQLQARSEQQYLPFTEIRERIIADARQYYLQQQVEQLIAGVIADYRVDNQFAEPQAGTL